MAMALGGMAVERGVVRPKGTSGPLGSEDTISAIATPMGLGGISIIRISGGKALSVGERCLRLVSGKKVSKLGTWSMALGRVFDPDSKKMVDEALVLVMRGPHSYTGEDVVEIQCHGGPLVSEKVLEITFKCGARQAEPGEFTKRAFLNGRISLEEAEAVMDVVTARSESSLMKAGERLRGELGATIKKWRSSLLELLAEAEAGLDFPDELDSPIDEGFVARMQNMEREMTELLDSAPLGLALANGVEIVLLGRPNVGKSSLFNALLGQERAIVTDIPGTTRDVLRERTEWFGIPIVLLDTAGLRSTREIVEMIGVEKAERAAEGAGVVFYILDDSYGINEEDLSWLKRFSEKNILAVINKADLGLNRVSRKELADLLGERVVSISCATGEGIAELKRKTADLFLKQEKSAKLVLGSARQVDCVRRAEKALSGALAQIRAGWTLDTTVLSLEEALRALMELTGENVSEEVLDVIFDRFCVGK